MTPAVPCIGVSISGLIYQSGGTHLFAGQGNIAIATRSEARVGVASLRPMLKFRYRTARAVEVSAGLSRGSALECQSKVCEK